MVSRMTASSFLHSKAGTGFLTYLCCAAAISAAIGVGLHYAGLRWFEQAKSEEQITALQLVDAFVAEYSDNRGKFLTVEPVQQLDEPFARGVALPHQTRKGGEECRLHLTVQGRIGCNRKDRRVVAVEHPKQQLSDVES